MLRAISENIGDSTVLASSVCKVVSAVASVVGCQDVRRGFQMGCECEVRPQLLADWRKFVGDPDDQVEVWFREGAPLGIVAKPLPRNIFPEYSEQDAANDPASLASETWDGKKSKAETDADAMKEVQDTLARGCLRR